jgi:hypothetical protein
MISPRFTQFSGNTSRDREQPNLCDDRLLTFVSEIAISRGVYDEAPQEETVPTSTIFSSPFLMFARTARTASTRLTQFSNQLAIQTRAMATANTRFKLNTGAEIPAVGFGTWQDKDSQEAAVAEALKAGYRHIDTASM